jgi:hypothetical protein
MSLFGPRIKISSRACCAMVVLFPCWSDIFLLLPCHSMSSHFHIIGIILMHTSHSCILVTETPEDAPVEPTETVETEPGAEFVVEQEKKSRQAAKHDPLNLFNLIRLSYLNGLIMYMLYAYLLHCQS